MEALQAIGGGSFLLVSGVLGFRLLFLAWRNRGVPEFLLGMAFVFGGVLGASVEACAQAVATSPGQAGMLLAFGKAFGLVGMLCNCLFTWWVFRRDDRWGPIAVASVMSVQIAGYVGHAATGAFATGIVQHVWFWTELAGRLASSSWLGVEAAIYWSRMRRRVEVGLAEPIVANRFLLWSIASVSGIALLMTSVPPVMLPAQHPIMQADMTLFAVSGIATASAYWLAFFPPDAYRRFIERTRPAATA